VLKVSRLSGKGAAVVVLSDGRSAKVPAGCAVWGGVIEDEELRQVDGKWVHVSLDTSGSKRKRSYQIFRDLSEFDSQKEMELIRGSILKCHREILGSFWSSDQLDDLVLDIFCKLFYRKCFQRWDPRESRYESYLHSAVRNCLIDYARRCKSRPDLKADSLNVPVGDSDTDRLDFLVDKSNQDFTVAVEVDDMLESMGVVAIDMGEAGSGATYAGILRAMLDGELDKYARSVGMSSGLVDKCVGDLRHSLRNVAVDYGYGRVVA
jgi:hypothetical protein